MLCIIEINYHDVDIFKLDIKGLILENMENNLIINYIKTMSVLKLSNKLTIIGPGDYDYKFLWIIRQLNYAHQYFADGLVPIKYNRINTPSDLSIIDAYANRSDLSINDAYTLNMLNTSLTLYDFIMK